MCEFTVSLSVNIVAIMSVLFALLPVVVFK